MKISFTLPHLRKILHKSDSLMSKGKLEKKKGIPQEGPGLSKAICDAEIKIVKYKFDIMNCKC